MNFWRSAVVLLAAGGMNLLAGCGDAKGTKQGASQTGEQSAADAGQAKAVSAGKPGAQMAGGWQEASTGDVGVRIAAEAAVNTLARKTGQKLKLDRIVSARTQVVAGTNYGLLLQVAGTSGGAKMLDAVVWKKLDGTYLLTKADWK